MFLTVWKIYTLQTVRIIFAAHLFLLLQLKLYKKINYSIFLINYCFDFSDVMPHLIWFLLYGFLHNIIAVFARQSLLK